MTYTEISPENHQLTHVDITDESFSIDNAHEAPAERYFPAGTRVGAEAEHEDWLLFEAWRVGLK